MPKEDVIELEGIVEEALPNANFKVRLENDHVILEIGRASCRERV